MTTEPSRIVVPPSLLAPSAPKAPVYVTVPPRWEVSAEARQKVADGKPITQQEQRLLILALPRKTRLKLKIRTTDVRATVNALRQMGDGVEARTGYTGNTAQHQQRYEAGQRAKARKAARAVDG